MMCAGKIIDADTGEAVGGVTASVLLRGVAIWSVVVDYAGRFAMDGVPVGASILFTHAEYKPVEWGTSKFEEDPAEIVMQKRVTELPEIVVTAGKKNVWALLGLAALVYFIVKRKK